MSREPVQLVWECLGWESDEGMQVDACGWKGESLSAVDRCPHCAGDLSVISPPEHAAAFAIGGWMAVWCMLHPELMDSQRKPKP